MNIQVSKILKTIADLQPPEHLCYLYESEEMRRDFVIQFIMVGLLRKEKVVYVAERPGLDNLVKWLKSADLDVEPCIQRGQLRLLTLEDSYLRSGVFNAENILAFWASEIEKSQSEGYPSIRVSAESDWLLKGSPDLNNVLEYENKINYTVPGYACLAVCQYNKMKLPSKFIMDLINCHPLIAMGGEIYHNFYYIPPNDFFAEKSAAAELERKLINLVSCKCVEEDLLHSEQRIESIIQNAREGMMVVDRRMQCLFWNNAMVRITGFPASEIVGQMVCNTHPAFGVFASKTCLEKALLGKTFTTHEIQYLNPITGKAGWFMGTYSPQYSVGNQIVGAVVVVSDITILKEAEWALAKNEERFQLAIKGTNDGIWDWNLSDNTIYYSDHWMEMIGFKSEEITNSHEEWLNRLHPEDLPKVLEAVDANWHGRINHFEITYRFRHKDGHYLWVLARAGTILGKDGHPVRMVGTHVDITKRKNDELALKESLEQIEQGKTKLDAIFSNSRDAMCVSADKLISMVNPAYVAMFGYDSDKDLIGLPLSTNISPDARFYFEGIVDNMERMAETSPVQEIKGVKKNGFEFDLEISFSTFEIDSKKYILAVMRDISERKANEIQLNRSLKVQKIINNLLNISLSNDSLENKLYNSLIEVLSAPWINMLPKGAIFILNKKTEMLEMKVNYDLSPDLLKVCAQVPMGRCLCGRAAQNQEHVFAPHVDERHENCCENMQDHGHYILPLMFEKQTLGVLDIYVEAGHNFNSQELAFLDAAAKVIVGAVKRDQDQAELQKFFVAIEQSPNSIIITDPKGLIEYTNPSFLWQSGYVREEVYGKNPRFIKSGKNPPEVYKQLWGAISSGKEWSGELLNQKKNGELYWETMVIAPVKDAQGKITNFVAIKRDITAQKKMQEQLLHTEKLASVGGLVAGIAHEINNPLAVVLGMSEVIIRSGAAENIVKDLEFIHAAGLRCRNIIQNLLKFARKYDSTKKPYDINVLINDTVELMRYVLSSNNIELVLQLDQTLPRIMIDHNQIQQVFVNLLTNAQDAITATKSPGKITITTCQDNNYAGIRVSDSGSGIPDEIAKRIFDPFYTTKEVGKGTGLGLSISYGIIQEHAGELLLTNNTPGATTFEILLPLKSRFETEIVKSKIADTYSGLNNKYILVVDDEPQIVRLIANVLQSKGAKPLTASCASEAQHILDKQLVEAIITDIKMPGMDGKDFYQWVKAHKPELTKKLVFCSGDTSSHETESFLRETGAPLITKPFVQDELFKVVNSLLE